MEVTTYCKRSRTLYAHPVPDLLIWMLRSKSDAHELLVVAV